MDTTSSTPQHQDQAIGTKKKPAYVTGYVGGLDRIVNRGDERAELHYNKSQQTPYDQPCMIATPIGADGQLIDRETFTQQAGEAYDTLIRTGSGG